MMRLRYMKEQRDRLVNNNLKTSRNKLKFNLDDDENDNQDFNFLTHKGKKIDFT